MGAGSQKSDQVTSLVGKPDSKGKDTMWEAIGEWVQEWRFKAQGLTFNMASQSKGGAKTIASVTAVSPCQLTTARGIQIGNRIADVTSRLTKKVQDKETPVPGKTGRRLNLRRSDLHLQRRQGLADLHRRRGGVVADFSFRIERFPPHRTVYSLGAKAVASAGATKFANHRSLIAGLPSFAGVS